jgi:hypothetical protein
VFELLLELGLGSLRVIETLHKALFAASGAAVHGLTQSASSIETRVSLIKVHVKALIVVRRGGVTYTYCATTSYTQLRLP